MITKALRVTKLAAAIAFLSLPLLCHATSQEKVLFDLPQCTSGSCPDTNQTLDRGLTFDKSGNLYSISQYSGASGSKCEGFGCGFVFKLTLGTGGTWKESVLYNFCSRTNCADGAVPSSALAIDSAGNLYGTTWYGGISTDCNDLGCGVVFKLTLGSNGKWTETVLFTFNGTNGATPEGTTPIFDSAGNLYGTTSLGGANNYGTVFELTPTKSGPWKETLLHSFNLTTAGTDGIVPVGLVFDSTGNLYGATGGGGKFSGSLCVNTQISDPHCGTVYRLVSKSGKWTEQILHNFQDNGIDGITPLTGVILDTQGNIYGTTEIGGKNSFGIVYELAKGTFAEKILLNFDSLGANSTGSAPLAGLTLDSAGNLYGTTTEGGAAGCGGGGCGTVYKLAPGTNGWSETVLYDFPSGNGGSLPDTAVVLDSSGDLYGATLSGGTHEDGVIYEIIP